DVLRVEAAVDRLPRLAGVIAAEGARGRDRDEDPLGMARVDKDRVEAHPACSRLPRGPGAMAAQSGQLLPGLPAVARAKQGGIFDPREDRVRIVERGLEMPDALEFPGTLRAVIKMV